MLANLPRPLPRSPLSADPGPCPVAALADRYEQLAADAERALAARAAYTLPNS